MQREKKIEIERAKEGLLIGMKKEWGIGKSKFLETSLDEIGHVRIKESKSN